MILPSVFLAVNRYFLSPLPSFVSLASASGSHSLSILSLLSPLLPRPPPPPPHLPPPPPPPDHLPPKNTLISASSPAADTLWAPWAAADTSSPRYSVAVRDICKHHGGECRAALALSQPLSSRRWGFVSSLIWYHWDILQISMPKCKNTPKWLVLGGALCSAELPVRTLRSCPRDSFLGLWYLDIQIWLHFIISVISFKYTTNILYEIANL